MRNIDTALHHKTGRKPKMDRRYLLTALAAFAAAPAAAQNTEATPLVDQIVAELKFHGYDEFRISRTFLGRTRIVAESRDRIREVVFDTSTGEILRDYWKDKAATSDRAFQDEEPPGKPSRSDGPGPSKSSPGGGNATSDVAREEGGNSGKSPASAPAN